jgi:phosphoribosylanthranilate isomerase
MERKIKLKICGMRDAENIMQVAALSPDYMGFIFYPKSPRYVGEDFKIPALFPTNIIRVGVFVNESTEVMLRLTKLHKLNFLQLHGSESVQQCEELRNNNIKIIKVLSIDEQTDLELTKLYSAAVDYMLFDTKGKFYGGNAETFRWQRLEQYDQDLPFFLSGGLTPENIKGLTALNNMNLHAIDVNSGAEILPGLKDVQKIGKIKDSLKTLKI